MALAWRRVFAVTAGLVVAGAVFGALAGVAALAISLLLTGEFRGRLLPEVFAIAAVLGAILGAVCAPIIGWLLLRHVPLGRAFSGLALGATVGGVAGWFLPQFAHGDGILIVAAVGALGAAVVLRIKHARAPVPRDPLALLLALLVAGQACSAGWHRPPDLTPGRPLDPRQQVQVWRAGTVVRWHAVAIGADSISGVVFHQPSECDSCRVAVPKATVDSIRFGDPVAGFWKSVALVLGAMAAFCYASCPRGLSFAADDGVR